MSDQWYYQAFGQEFGPFAEEELARMLSTGELTADDDVRQGSSGPWKRAGSVQALVSLASSVAVETAEVATDIDSFLLVDEQEAPPPRMSRTFHQPIWNLRSTPPWLRLAIWTLLRRQRSRNLRKSRPSGTSKP